MWDPAEQSWGEPDDVLEMRLVEAGEWPAPSTVIDLYGAWAAAVADAFGVA